MDKNKIKFVQYNSKKEFLDQNLDILLQDEAQNEIIIGIVLEHKSEKVNRWLLGRIEYDSQVKIVFIVDDDKQGLLTYIPSDKLEDEIVECLVKNILDLKIDLKEMLIENKFSDKILNAYIKQTHKKVSSNICFNILKLNNLNGKHELEENEKLIKVSKENANMDELKNIVKSIYTDTYLYKECSDEKAIKIANIFLEKGIYILTDNEEKDIYSHAVTVRKQINGCTIGGFITPQKFRGKGYGKKFLYNLCKKLLEDGNKFLTLQVRESNQKAINLYENIGFERYIKYERNEFEKNIKLDNSFFDK